MNGLRTWRRNRRDSDLYNKALHRARYMTEPELTAQIDLTLMQGAGSLQRYRGLTDHQAREDMLLDLRIHLEASLAMLDTVLEKSAEVR